MACMSWIAFNLIQIEGNPLDHVMFRGLKESLVEGRTAKGALICERAGRVEVEFKVAAPGMSNDTGSEDTAG